MDDDAAGMSVLRRGRCCCGGDGFAVKETMPLQRGRFFRDGDDAAAAGTGQCFFTLYVVSARATPLF